MKGPTHIPTTKDLVSAYEKLQAANSALSETDLVKYSQWTRFDPRLLEQLIAHFAKYWQTLSPVRLNKEIANQFWPQALAICLEQCGLLVTNDRKLFSNWLETAVTDFKPAPYQSFFIGLRPFASKSTRAKALNPTSIFKKWGFAEDELQINKIEAYPENSFSKSARENLLKQFVEGKKFFHLHDYIEASRYSISVRQAQRDLKSFSWIRAVGNTKARYYSMKKPPQGGGFRNL